MGLYLARTFKRMASGKKLVYYVLRINVWDPKEKRQKTRYVAYIGKLPVLTLERAQKLAKRLKISLDDLERIRGLRILHS